jgi:hypothetical protein
MNRLTRLLAIAATALAAACSTPSTEVAPPPSADAAAVTQEDAPQLMTGSRIPRKSTDRLLRTTEAAGAKEMRRDQPPNPGPRVN